METLSISPILRFKGEEDRFCPILTLRYFVQLILSANDKCKTKIQIAQLVDNTLKMKTLYLRFCYTISSLRGVS